MFQKGAYIAGLCFVSVLSELCQQTCAACAQCWAPWKEGTRPRSSRWRHPQPRGGRRAHKYPVPRETPGVGGTELRRLPERGAREVVPEEALCESGLEIKDPVEKVAGNGLRAEGMERAKAQRSERMECVQEAASRAGQKVESTVGVGGLGARAGAVGGDPTTRGLGFKARELDVILGTVAASRLFEWQGGAPVREPCPREVTHRSGRGLLDGLGKVLPVGSSSVSSSVRWTQQGGLRPLRARALGRGLAEGQLGKRQSRGAVSDRPSRPCRHLRGRLHAEARGAELTGRHQDSAEVHRPTAVLHPGRRHRVRDGPVAGQGPGGPGGVQHGPGATGREMRCVPARGHWDAHWANSLCPSFHGWPG